MLFISKNEKYDLNISGKETCILNIELTLHKN